MQLGEQWPAGHIFNIGQSLDPEFANPNERYNNSNVIQSSVSKCTYSREHSAGPVHAHSRPSQCPQQAQSMPTAGPIIAHLPTAGPVHAQSLPTAGPLHAHSRPSPCLEQA